MAPELFDVVATTSASDIWSLGCLIVELLVGDPPYHHLSQNEILYNLLECSKLPPIPENISRVFILIIYQYIKMNNKKL